MKEIRLTRGHVALVDDADFDALSRFKWSALVRRTTTYAVRCAKVDGKSTAVLMHREITGAAKGEQVDHQDGNGLNNTRANLRLCNQRQNSQNMRDRPGSSRFKGVSWHTTERRWRAAIKVDGKQVHLGLYDDEEHAARVYDHAAREHFGRFARPNFPDDHSPVPGTRRAKSSKYRGVTRVSPRRWVAFIVAHGQRVGLGSFTSEEDAARAHDREAVRVHGHKAKLNFDTARVSLVVEPERLERWQARADQDGLPLQIWLERVADAAATAPIRAAAE